MKPRYDSSTGTEVWLLGHCFTLARLSRFSPSSACSTSRSRSFCWCRKARRDAVVRGSAWSAERFRTGPLASHLSLYFFFDYRAVSAHSLVGWCALTPRTPNVGMDAQEISFCCSLFDRLGDSLGCLAFKAFLELLRPRGADRHFDEPECV